MAEALEEMNWDVEHWLLLLPNPRTPEAKAILREIDHWVLLSTCDHDGVVSSYRMLKGLAEVASTAADAFAAGCRRRRAGDGASSRSCPACASSSWTGRSILSPPCSPRRCIGEHLILIYRTSRDKGADRYRFALGDHRDFIAASKVQPVAAEPAQKVREHLLADVVIEEDAATEEVAASEEASAVAETPVAVEAPIAKAAGRRPETRCRPTRGAHANECRFNIRRRDRPSRQRRLGPVHPRGGATPNRRRAG